MIKLDPQLSALVETCLKTLLAQKAQGCFSEPPQYSLPLKVMMPRLKNLKSALYNQPDLQNAGALFSEINQTLKAHPTRAVVWAFIGRFARHCGFIDLAEKFIIIGFDADPENPGLLTEKAKILLARKSPEKALACIRRVLEERHPSITALKIAAEAAFERYKETQNPDLLEAADVYAAGAARRAPKLYEPIIDDDFAALHQSIRRAVREVRRNAPSTPASLSHGKVRATPPSYGQNERS